MFLDVTKANWTEDMIPFTKNGIFIDTTILKIFIDGLIETRIAKRARSGLTDYNKIISLFDLLKLNKWDKFYITPHILTEVCSHIRNDYNKRSDYQRVIEELFPVLKEVQEKIVTKEQILSYIDITRPIVEIGDISIYAITDESLKLAKGNKACILSDDSGINKKYEDCPNVMVIDFRSCIWNQM